MDGTAMPQKLNPRQRANLLSRWIFAWTVPLFYRGTKQGLEANDVGDCVTEDQSEQLGDRLEEAWHKELARAERDSRKPSLRKALFRCFLWPTIGNGALCFLAITLRTLIPGVLARLLLQYQHLAAPVVNTNSTQSLNPEVESGASLAQGNSTHDPLEEILNKSIYYLWNDLYGLGTVLVVLNLICCLLRHHLDLRQTLVGARMRIACCSLVYRKTLRLSMKTAGQTSPGYLVNLLSNDVNRLDYSFFFMHWIWILPIQSVLVCYLIWLRIGIPAFVGVIGLLLKTVPLQSALSKLTSKLRMRIAERTDVRVGIMNELVQGIQVIKMYAWEKPFQAIVAEARRLEVQQIRYASYLRAFYLSTRALTDRSTLYITLAAAVVMGQSITSEAVFSAYSYFNILQLVAANWYPLAVTFGAEALVSLRRVQVYLELEEREDQNLAELTEGDPTVIELKDVVASWNPECPQFSLRHFSLKIKKGQLCAIIGPVGAGKSSLLQLLLGELPIVEGSVSMQGDLSYAAQEPWLFNDTVRNNILFGEQFDSDRYQEVVQTCALQADFKQLTNGDRTIVGERGATLSGGQRSRLSLARAVYKPVDIYLLDDPLSAVDAQVGRHLFDEVIGPRGHLAKRKATRLLVTHQVHFLLEADWIVVVDQGGVLIQGTYQDLVNSEVDLTQLLQRAKESAAVKTLLETETEQDEDIPYIDDDSEGYQALRKQSKAPSERVQSNQNLAVVGKVEELPEAQASGGVSGRVWWEYFRAGSSILGICFTVFIILLSQFICSGTDYFSGIWTQQEERRSLGEATRFSSGDCLVIYGALVLLVLLTTVYRGYLFFGMAMHASKVLHNRMFSSVLHATMRFFDTNPSGRILNRFSKDMGAMDELLPRALLDLIQVVFATLGNFAVIAVLHPLMLGAVAVVCIIIVLVVRLSTRPTHDLKRLEGSCRSPVFSHLSSSLLGLSVIRSCGKQDNLARQFDQLQNVHSSVWHLLMNTNTALALWMDCLTCAFLAVVTYSFIAVNETTFSAIVGLAISQALSLTGVIQFSVRQLNESLQQMTSVERILQYTDLEQEEEQQLSEKWVNKPSEDWPTAGRIELRDMSCRYDPSGSAVLRHLNLIIEPGWKVGIVGRTGAGKSSLIGALFRLTHIEGGIYIDGIDTAHIELETLRARISIIPQNPVLFSASIRYNLDPFERYSDAQLWQSLEDVELRAAIPGLDFMVTERGSNFSVGQRQLLCLARAILRNNRILVMDEATANVDPQTDALIQRTIRVKFRHCTVFTVAHRLHTVMDSDRIIVMDAGSAVEFDVPHVLLQQPQGVLRQMVEATDNESDALKKLASDAFKQLQQE